MAKFVFKLEAVLRQRRMVEQERQRAVAAVERERVSLEQTVRTCQAMIVQERADLRTRLTGENGIDVGGVRLQAAASMQIVARAQRAVLQLAGVHKRLDAARGELLEATRRRRAIEILKESRRQEWLNTLRVRENAELDELVVMRHHAAADAVLTVQAGDDR